VDLGKLPGNRLEHLIEFGAMHIGRNLLVIWLM